jgi:ABC transporter transmembrane region.
VEEKAKSAYMSGRIGLLYQYISRSVFNFFQTLKLSMIALRETTVGQSVNLLSNDVNRFDSALVFLVYLWFGPLQTLIMLYLMWREIGFAALIGVGTIILVIPIQGVYNLFK